MPETGKCEGCGATDVERCPFGGCRACHNKAPGVLDWEGRTQDNPFFFKPLVDHEISLSTEGKATISRRQLTWQVKIETPDTKGKTAIVYLDHECRLQATPFGDGTEMTADDLRMLRSFIGGELNALVISLTRLQ